MAEGERGERFTPVALIVTMIANQMGVVIVSPLVVDIAATFGVSVPAAGQLRTAAALSSGLLAPWIGLVSERAGRKPLLVGGLLLVALGAVGSALAPTFPALLAVQAVNGIGIAALLSMGFAAVGDYFPAERRAWAVGLVTIGQPLAWVLGLPLIGFLADGWGWRWSFVGGPLLFSLVGLWFATRLPAPRGSAAAVRSGLIGGLAAILRERSAAAWVFSELASYTGWAGSLTFLGAFYIFRFDLTAGTASLLLALTALGFVGGSLLAHRLAGARGPRAVILASAVSSALLMAAAFAAPLPLAITVMLLVLFGLSQGIRGATSSSLGLRQAARYRGTMMALRASVVQFGYVFGGLIGGLLLGPADFAGLGAVYALLLGLAGVAIWRFVEDKDE